MLAHAGEVAEKTADIFCEQCGKKLHIVEGDDIPRCPECDGDTYGDARMEHGRRNCGRA